MADPLADGATDLAATEPAPHFWRVETDPLRVVVHHLAERGVYAQGDPSPRVRVDEPFPVDLTLAERLPARAR